MATLLCDVVGVTLLHSLWQVAVIHLAYLFIRTCIPRPRINARYLVGVVAILLILCSFTVTAVVTAKQIHITALTAPAVGLGHTTDDADESGTAPASHLIPDELGRLRDPPRDAPGLLDNLALHFARWKVTVVLLWVGGVVALAITQVAGLIAIRRLLRCVMDAAPDEVDRWCQLADRLDVRRLVQFVKADGVFSPMTFGWLKPVVVLPAALTSHLSVAEVDAIIAHELAHIRRLDYLVNQLQIVMESLLYYHPSAWLLSSRVRRDREMCCDVMAVKVCETWHVLGEALYRIATSVRPNGRFALAAAGGSLVERIAFMDARSGGATTVFSPRIATLFLVAACAAMLGMDLDRRSVEALQYRSAIRTHESVVVREAFHIGNGSTRFRSALVTALEAARHAANPSDPSIAALVTECDSGVPMDLVWTEYAAQRSPDAYPTQTPEFGATWEFSTSGTQRRLARLIWKRAAVTAPGVEQIRVARAALAIASMRRECSGIPALATIVLDPQFAAMTGCDKSTADRLRRYVALSSDALAESVDATRSLARLIRADASESELASVVETCLQCGDRLPEINYVVAGIIAEAGRSPTERTNAVEPKRRVEQPVFVAILGTPSLDARVPIAP